MLSDSICCQCLTFVVSVFAMLSGSYLCCQGLDWLQVKVVVQMKVVEILTVDQKVEHVVTLATHL